MMKTSSSETKRLREAERKKKEKESANRLKYYYANRESINRKRREKRAQARELKAARQVIDTMGDDRIDNSSKPKKYDWALYKRRQRARAKEEIAKKEGKAKCKRRRKEGEVSIAFSSRMSKKRSSNN